MLRINPRFVKKYRLNKLTRQIIKTNKSRNKSKNLYGNAFILDIKKTGIILDLVIPMTFGLITLCLVKYIGNKEIKRFNIDLEPLKSQIKDKILNRNLYKL